MGPDEAAADASPGAAAAEAPAPDGTAGPAAPGEPIDGPQRTAGGEGRTQRLEDLFRFTYEHRVRYEEVDAQGVVGSASWLTLLQLARIEYFRHLGLSLEGGRSPIQVFVRRAAIDCLAPARFDDPLLLRVRTSGLGASSATLRYVVDDLESGLRPLVGETVVVCVELSSMRSLPWPQVVRERIAELERGNLVPDQA